MMVINNALLIKNIVLDVDGGVRRSPHPDARRRRRGPRAAHAQRAPIDWSEMDTLLNSISLCVYIERIHEMDCMVARDTRFAWDHPAVNQG